MLINIGLGLIALAWLYQFLVSLREGKSLNTNSILLYSAGVLFLVIDGYQQGVGYSTYLNAVALLAAIGAWAVSRK